MSQQNTTTKDEIDLLALFQKLYRKFKELLSGLFKLIIYFIVFIVKNVHFLILSAIVGALIGFGLHKVSKEYFSSDLIAQANGVSNADIIGYLNDLHVLCTEKNVGALTALLTINDSIAAQIKDIQAYWIIDINRDKIGDYVDYKRTVNLKDTTVQCLQNRFNLRVELFDNTSFDKVRSGLYKYIKRNPYYQKLNEIRRKDLDELIAQTNHEIDKLDSLQDIEYYQKDKKPFSPGGQIAILTEKQTQLYYHDKLDLLARKQSYEQELILSAEPITVIKDFTPLAKAENPMSKYVIKFAFLFSIVGFLLLALLKNWTLVKGYLSD